MRMSDGAPAAILASINHDKWATAPNHQPEIFGSASEPNPIQYFL